MKSAIIYTLTLAAALTASCEQWNDPGRIGQQPQTPATQNPEAYERYLQGLRDYKATEHPLVVGYLENAPEVSLSEKDFMRSLPDSLDMVVLCRADRITPYDEEDMPLLRRKGTKVLYRLDLTPFAAALSSGTLPGELTSRLEKAAAEYASHGFDGVALVADMETQAGESTLEAMQGAGTRITDFLRDVCGEEGVLIYDGSPLLLNPGERARYDYWMIRSQGARHILDVQARVAYLHNHYGVPLSGILVSGTASGTISGFDNAVAEILPQMAALVNVAGPLAGLCVCNVGEDYYDEKVNYRRTRQAIELLNPSR